MGLRLLLLLLLVHLTYLSLLRAREHEADLLADKAQSRSGPEPNTPSQRGLAGQPRQRGYRSFLPTFLLAHPTSIQRAAALNRPQLTARLSMLEFLSIGIGAGVIFQELAFAVGAVMPGAPQAAYWITGAIVAGPVSAVTIAALWRHCLVGPGPVRRSTAMAAGALLGVGLLAGSQLSPRAAANWGMVRMTISPVLPSNLSLSVIGLRGAAGLALVVVAGSAVFMLWALVFARELTAVSRRSHAWLRRMSTGLAVAVLAVPLGTWFMVFRLAGDSVNGQQGTSIADLLQGHLRCRASRDGGRSRALDDRSHDPLQAGGTATAHNIPRRQHLVRNCRLVPTAAWSAGAALRHGSAWPACRCHGERHAAAAPVGRHLRHWSDRSGHHVLGARQCLTAGSSEPGDMAATRRPSAADPRSGP